MDDMVYYAIEDTIPYRVMACFNPPPLYPSRCPVNPWLKIVNRGGMERVKSEHKEA